MSGNHSGMGYHLERGPRELSETETATPNYSASQRFPCHLSKKWWAWTPAWTPTWSSWCLQPIWKMWVKLYHFPRDWGEISKYSKPPPTYLILFPRPTAVYELRRNIYTDLYSNPRLSKTTCCHFVTCLVSYVYIHAALNPHVRHWWGTCWQMANTYKEKL